MKIKVPFLLSEKALIRTGPVRSEDWIPSTRAIVTSSGFPRGKGRLRQYLLRVADSLGDHLDSNGHRGLVTDLHCDAILANRLDGIAHDDGFLVDSNACFLQAQGDVAAGHRAEQAGFLTHTFTDGNDLAF